MIKMSEDFVASILIKRMQWTNKIIKCILCMKPVEDNPVGWPTMRVFSEIKMCIHVIAALPLDLANAYLAIKGCHFPMVLWHWTMI